LEYSHPEYEVIAQMLSLKELNVQYVTDDTGAKNAVIISYEAFQELLEDLEDLSAAAERRDEPTISHEALLTELKRDGLLPD
ncbi:MAG: hypothetical protein ACE5FD_07090, partial [Anaerolineae bacterium]